MAVPGPQVDIAIAGAGQVGGPLAHALSSQGWKVVLLDGSDQQAGRTAQAGSPADLKVDQEAHPEADLEVDAPGLRQRCTAVSLGTRQWLERHGLWSVIAGDAEPIRQVHVSHKGHFGVTRLSASELHVDALGYVVDNNRLTAAVLDSLRDTAVEHRQGARVSSVTSCATHVEISFANGAPLAARLLIAADGGSSVVREASGIGTTQVDYQQAAVLTTIRLVGDHAGIAYERFTPSGPLALLPRPDSHMSVVECLETSERDGVAALDASAYLARLQSRFGYRLGRFAAVGPRLVVPLIRIEAMAQTAVRTVLLGSAVRLLHPVGGQGYNLAMRDVAELVHLLGGGSTEDPGTSALLAAFVKARQGDQQRTVRFTDTLARSFRGQAAIPGHARSLALLGLDTLGPLRREFARRSMGLVS